jgi:D-tyrosyl-tRNA(Tyr) deacylase
VQRVKRASVDVVEEGTTTRVGEIGGGLLVLLGVTHTDDEKVAAKLAAKIWNLRIMDDERGVMNLSVADTTRSLLVVSQFTLYGDTTSGRRPGWVAAARPEHAEPLVDHVVDELRRLGGHVETGRFRTYMNVELVNDGPTTVMIDV